MYSSCLSPQVLVHLKVTEAVNQQNKIELYKSQTNHLIVQQCVVYVKATYHLIQHNQQLIYNKTKDQELQSIHYQARYHKIIISGLIVKTLQLCLRFRVQVNKTCLNQVQQMLNHKEVKYQRQCLSFKLTKFAKSLKSVAKKE